jgi:iron complex outermembrane receptor protein
MTSRKQVACAIRHVLFTGALAAVSLPALAQQAGGTQGAAIEEVVVTGSRIRGITNAESASPISVATAEEIALTKATNLEDVLARMTGVTLGATMASNNGGAGVSTVALRDIGSQRTLILIDGQRLIPIFYGSTSSTDLNMVPVAMIERIEVLRDGASSIYGADAIGGVVNIITKKKSDGVTFDLGFGESGHSDAKTTNLAASAATNTEKGNVMVAVSLDKTDPLIQSARSWGVATHGSDPHYPGGSTYRSQLNTLQDEYSSAIWIGGTQYSRSDPNVVSLLPHVAYLPGSGRVKLNAGAWNDIQQGIDRKQVSFNTHYDLSSNVTFVADGFFSDKTTEGALRPEPLLGDTIATTAYAGLVIPTYAPGNTTDGPITAFLTPEQFGPRQYDDHATTSRIRVGFEGKVFGDYHWELGFADQHNTTSNVTHNEGNFNALAQMTGAITCLDVPGGCRAPTATEISYYTGAGLAVPGAVPVNMPNFFNGPYMFTPQQVKYLTWDNTDNNVSTERYAYANIGGKLFDLPAGAVRGVIGVEHRDEYEADTPDKLVQEGWGPNQSAPTGGGYSVSSVYAELNIPVLKDMPGAKSLVLTPSGRHDKYNTFGNADTWKLGLEWAPIDDLRVRGSYATGFRAPQVAELFSGQVISDLTANGDPCDTRAAGYNGNSNVGKGVLTAGSTCSKAVAGGAAVTNFFSGNNEQTAQQQQVAIGGNPGLLPEKSKSFGYGFVFTPTFARGLSFAVDYYNIRIDNTILTGGVVGATSVDSVLLGCYGPQQNTAYCALVTRGPTGTITQINSLNSNFGTAKVSGLDFEFTYDTARAGIKLPFPGSLRFDLQAEEQYKNTQTNADGSLSSYVGSFQYSNEGFNPHWKGFAALDYTVGDWGVHWDTRFYESTVNFDDPTNHVYGNYTPNIYYHAISGSYSLRDVGVFKSARFVLGINNLLDKDPPFIGQDSICKCNTLAGPFDTIGRFYYARISLKF